MFEIIGIIAATTNQNFIARMGTGAGPSWDSSSNYAWSAYRWAQGGSAFAGSGSANLIGLDGNGGVRGSTASTPFTGTYRLFSPQDTSLATYLMGQASYVDQASAILGVTLTGIYLPTTAVTGVQFLFTSGNITSGIIRVYGVVK